MDDKIPVKGDKINWKNLDYQERLDLLLKTREDKEKRLNRYVRVMGITGGILGCILSIVHFFSHDHALALLLLAPPLLFIGVAIFVNSRYRNFPLAFLAFVFTFLLGYIIYDDIVKAIEDVYKKMGMSDMLLFSGNKPQYNNKIIFWLVVILGSSFTFSIMYAITRVRIEFQSSFLTRVIVVLAFPLSLIPIGVLFWQTPWDMVGSFFSYSFKGAIQHVEHAWVILLFMVFILACAIGLSFFTFLSAIITIDKKRSRWFAHAGINFGKAAASAIILSVVYYHLLHLVLMILEGVFIGGMFLGMLYLLAVIFAVVLMVVPGIYGFFGRIAFNRWSKLVDQEVYRLKIELAPDGIIS